MDAHWFAGGSRFWYRNDLPDDKREFVLVNAEGGIRQAAFDHTRAADALARAGVAGVTAERLPIDVIEFADDGKSVRLFGSDKSWRLNLSDYSIVPDNKPVDGDSDHQLRATRRPRPRRTRDRTRTSPSSTAPATS